MIARVAVDTTVATVDRLYDYTIPSGLINVLKPGMRVTVPFGKGNRHIEAMVLELSEKSDYARLKSIESVLDETPALSDEMLKLAVHIRSRLNCTFYTVIRSMLPSGLWYKRQEYFSVAEDAEIGEKDSLSEIIRVLRLNGQMKVSDVYRLYEDAEKDAEKLLSKHLIVKKADFSSQAKEKTRLVYSITDEGYAALDSLTKNRRNSSRIDVLNLLADSGCAEYKEIEYYTGASRELVNRMASEGLIDRGQERVLRLQNPEAYIPHEITYNNDQQNAINGIGELLKSEKPETALLFGVTGSGKTEVYIELIKKVLAENRNVIMLVPEIALTPQFVSRFNYEFGNIIAVLHSGLGIGERFDEWQRIKNGEVKVVVGTRSAVFAPIENIGLIIMDEEHESTFKSDHDPRYHARDVAQYRCYQNKALLLLGSATPSIDTAYHAKNGDYAYFSLDKRAVPVGLPKVIVADKRAAYRSGYHGSVGPELLHMLTETIDRGEQAILFLNRRGTSRSINCMECGHVPTCVNCSAALSYHRENGRLVCHQCGYSIKMIDECPVCGSRYLEQIGAGTQYLEDEITEILPDAKVIRMDSDTTSFKNSHEQLLSRFASGEADILIGTQMIAKGLNFPNVTLSAVIDADMSLYTGDFRSSERTFSLITQVVGRSGRAEKPGYAVIQTVSPHNEVIEAAAKQDYWSFYKSEIALRKSVLQPPFSRYVLFTVSSALDSDAYAAASRLANTLNSALTENSNIEAAVLGPAQAPIHKLNNLYRYNITLRCEDSKQQRELITKILYAVRSDKLNQKCTIDSDIYI